MNRDLKSTTGFAQACGATLRYELAGDGPVLVLIHSGLTDCRMYDDQISALARHRRVLRYDLHGYGRSSWPEGPYTHHEALHELLDQLEIDRATLLGTSLGGGVALDFALAYPDMVDALVTVAAGIGGYPQTPEDERLFAPVVQAFTDNDYTTAIDLMIHIWVDGPDRNPEEVDARLRDRVRALYTDVLLRTREGGRQPEQLDPPAYVRLDQIHVPTLVLVGDADIPAVKDQADQMAGSIDNARKVVLPNVAHLLNMEIPDEFNCIVLDFLGGEGLAR